MTLRIIFGRPAILYIVIFETIWPWGVQDLMGQPMSCGEYAITDPWLKYFGSASNVPEVEVEKVCLL